MVRALCLLALALRLAPAFQNRFHADEALYASWAMHIASGRDVLLASVPVDKPPLSMYAMAASVFIFGRAEIAARLPNLIASVASVALVWRWAKGLAGSTRALKHSSGLIAALVMALSPLNVAFGGTAFLDPLMVMWGLAACVAAARGKAGLAGICLGLAFATKTQGLLYAPLVILSFPFWARTNTDGAGCKFRSAPVHGFLRPLVTCLGCLALVATAVFAWDVARGGTPFWVQQAINYGGIRFVSAREIGARFSGWLERLVYLAGPILGAAAIAGFAWIFFHALWIGRHTRAAAINLLLLAYTLGFVALHWLLAFPVWDRYLLALAPVAALLLGRGAWLIAGGTSSHSQLAIRPVLRWLAPGVVAASLLPFALPAARSELPIGGDHGAHDGIDRVAAFLRDLPAGTVVYDHWLGWELDYYLWDAPVYRAYFDTPAELARDMSAFGQASTRYLVFPAGESPGKIARAIGEVGFVLTPVLETADRFERPSFIVYELTRDGGWQMAYRVSHIAYRISHIAYRISRIAYRVSHIAYRISRIAYRISHIAYRISHIAYRVSHIAYRISHIAYRISHIAYRGWRMAYRLSSDAAVPSNLQSPTSPTGGFGPRRRSYSTIRT